MWNLRESRRGRVRALAIVVACAGVLTGCITQTAQDAATGDAATTNTRTLTFVDAPSLDLGTVATGSSTFVRVSISSTGTGQATVSAADNSHSAFDFNGGSFPGTGGTCSQPIQGNCSLGILFTPSTAGVYSNVLSLSYSNGIDVTGIALTISATVTAAPSLTINGSATYAFGTKTVGSSTDATLTVANVGGMTASSLSFSGLSISLSFKGGTYPGTGGTCGTALNAAATCTVVVTYAPLSAGPTSQTLSVSYTDVSATAYNATVPITGTAISPASLSITNPAADPYPFGTVTIGAPAADVTLTVSNTGGQSATALSATGLSAPFSFKDGSYPGTGGNCGATLAASATCTMVVSFLPTTPTTETNTLDLAYADGTGATIHLTKGVRGIGGNAAVLSISDGPTYDFGTHAVSTTTDYTFTVTNTGGSSATVIAGGALTAPFQYKDGSYPGTGGSCATSLGVAANCTIVLSFVPTSTGGYTDTLSLGYTNGISSVNSTRALSGTGGTVANLTISDGATYDYGSVVKNYTVTKTFTITNVGGSGASAMSGAALSAPYSYSGGGAYPGLGGTCGNSLAAAATCTVLITYSPTGTGVSNATFTLGYNNSVSGTSSARSLTGTGATISKIAGGASHTCALYSTGIVKCWGSNAYGQLGDGTGTDSAAPVSADAGATDLASGANHVCTLSSGRIFCWGRDNHGQIGDNASLTNVNAPTQAATYTDFTQVSAGGDSTCGLRSGGTIVCWGNDGEGANGNDAAFSDSATPVTVSGLTTMVNVSVGRGHACGARSTGSFRCWGANAFGQIGDGTTTDTGTPINPSSASSLTAAVGGDTTCDLLSTGSVRCWGADDYGQLADGGGFASLTTPTTITNLANYTALVLGLKHGCGINSGGAVLCWGRDDSGQIGNDVALADQTAPVTVPGMSSASAVGVGENHSCGVLSTGLVYCWGENASKQLGDTTTTDRATPVLVQGL